MAGSDPEIKVVDVLSKPASVKLEAIQDTGEGVLSIQGVKGQRKGLDLEGINSEVSMRELLNAMK